MLKLKNRLQSFYFKIKYINILNLNFIVKKYIDNNIKYYFISNFDDLTNLIK